MYKKLGFIPLSLALVTTLSVGATNVLATDETTNENDEEMTEVVDQGNNNQDEVSQKENSNIENSKSMDNQEDSVDIEQQSQAVGIDVENFGFPSRSGSHTLSVGTTTLPYGTVYFVDANGNKVANEDGITEVPLTLDMVSGFDSSSVGNREVTVNYGGFSKTIEFQFTVIMPNLNYGGTQDDTVNDIVKNEIMSLMKNNPRITITDIAKALNISRPTATRKIKEVKIDNYIYRIGSDKKGSWIVNER